MQSVSLTRRRLLGGTALSFGAAALGELLAGTAPAAETLARSGVSGVLNSPHVEPRAKRVIYLFMQGGPSQLDLFDPKPELRKRHGEELPDSIRMGQRITGMTSKQSSLPVAPSPFHFRQHGKCGAWFSEVLPELAKAADDLCIVRSVHTEAINHDPAITYLQTGTQQPGRPCFGSWVSYGLGTENRDLPTFTVLFSRGSAVSPADPLFARLWGAGFLPSSHQGVCFRSSGDPVLYLSNPAGLSSDDRRRMLDTLGELNREQLAATHDPEIETRISQYEMAYRMQTSVPELTNLGDETDETYALYGEESRTPGTFAANCLMARRLVERGVRFVQLYHRGWDQHYNLPTNLRMQARDIDRASAALIADLKRRGLLNDTLVVWGGEFGRTTYSQGKLTATNFGRDHHGRCFTMWMAGGGMRPGLTYGKTDDYCYGVVEDGVHIHDLNATLLHALGVDHARLTYKFQGRYYRLTDVEGRVVTPLLA